MLPPLMPGLMTALPPCCRLQKKAEKLLRLFRRGRDATRRICATAHLAGVFDDQVGITVRLSSDGGHPGSMQQQGVFMGV